MSRIGQSSNRPLLDGRYVIKSGDTMTGQLKIAPSTDLNLLRLIINSTQTNDILSIFKNDGVTKLFAFLPGTNPTFKVNASASTDFIQIYHTGSGGYGQIESSTGFVLASDNGTASMTGTVNPQLRVQNVTANFNSITLWNDDSNGFISTSNNAGGGGHLSVTPAGDFRITPTSNITNVTQGKMGIGVAAPLAVIHLKAGVAAANGAPLKLTTGVNLTTPEAGVIEYDGNNFYLTT